MHSPAAPPPAPALPAITRRTALVALVLITLVGGALRFYGISRSAPYHHFHIDEHYVLMGADLLRDSMEKAAMSPKFFMYAPLPMYLVNAARAVYEFAAGPLDLSKSGDAGFYVTLARGISALLGTLTIVVVYGIGRRLGGRLAGLVAAALLAFAVLHVRDSHFFTVDVTLVFFCAATLAAAVAMAATGLRRWYVAAGVAFGLALACKYSAVFLAPLLVVAHACSPHTPRQLKPFAPWMRWAVHGSWPVLLGAAVFLLVDPMVWLYPDKFAQDVREQITLPVLGAAQPLHNAHFRDVQPQLYWFVNLLPWGIGPLFAAWGLTGLVWLALRRTRLALVAAAYLLGHYLVSGQTVQPFIRYTLPLIPGLAVAAGAFSSQLIGHPRWRRFGLAATALVVAASAAYAAAYTNIYRSPDVRLEASRVLQETVPQGAALLVEPSHNTPPTGHYLTAPSFYRDYVGWGQGTIRSDYYRLYTLDVYQYLYRASVPAAEKLAYIQGRLASVNYIVLDDTFLELYDHLSDADHGVVRQYYRDLFAGRLGFQLVHHLQALPSLFGWSVDDEDAEFTFTLFDHPEIFIFKRTAPIVPAASSE